MFNLLKLTKPRQKASILIATFFVLAQLPLILLSFTVANAEQPLDVGNPNPPGNNSTLKVHKQGSESGFEDNEPKVCEFNFEGFDFDEDQEGYIVIEGQGQSDGTDFGPYDIFGPADDEGYYATEYFNTDPGVDDIDDGHYKATLYGKDTVGEINLEDEKAKSKVFKVECDEEEEEDETGTLQVNKVLLDEDGDVQGGNTEANTLGFEWVLNGGTYSNLVKSMGTSVTEVEAGDYTVTENIAEVEGYEFVGYYEGQEGTCDDVEADTTLPISVTVVADTTTFVTLCNQEEEGEVLGDSDTVTTGEVLGAQVTAPVGGVGAGGGGSVIGSLFGLATSLTALGYGGASLIRKQ
jgi:hypothetical protein